MTSIAITGAAGNVGRTLLDAFVNHDVTPITYAEEAGIDSVVCDVTDRDAFVDALEGQDVLIHLAGNSSPYADWDAVHDVNVDGVYNAYEAAVENDLDRVVFASSNHAVNMDTITEADEPETMSADADTVRPDSLPDPDSYYGVTKVTGEALGSYYAAAHDLEVVNVRIGWLMDESDLADTQEDPDSEYPEDAARFARAMWLSPRDCRHVMQRAATADVPSSPLTVHATSRNDERVLSLTHTQRTLGYKPRDNASESLSE